MYFSTNFCEFFLVFASIIVTLRSNLVSNDITADGCYLSFRHLVGN